MILALLCVHVYFSLSIRTWGCFVGFIIVVSYIVSLYVSGLCALASLCFILAHYTVNHAIFKSFVSCHPVVAVSVIPNLIVVSMRVFCYDGV